MSYADQMKAAKEAGTAKDLTPGYLEWKKKGDEIIGKLVSKSPVSGKLSGQSYLQYLFDTDNGLVKCAFGTATDNEIKALVMVGGVYACTFKGQEKIGGGRKINRFEILELTPPESIVVGGSDDVPF